MNRIAEIKQKIEELHTKIIEIEVSKEWNPGMRNLMKEEIKQLRKEFDEIIGCELTFAGAVKRMSEGKIVKVTYPDGEYDYHGMHGSYVNVVDADYDWSDLNESKWELKAPDWKEKHKPIVDEYEKEFKTLAI